jgi:uncharacterized protein YcfJ
MKTLQTASIIGITFIVTASLAAPAVADHLRYDESGYYGQTFKKHGPKKHAAKHRGNKKHSHKNKFYDYAKVIKITPIFKQVKVSTPRQECWDEHSTRPVTREVHTDSTGNAIVGGIIGGVLGHQVGGGRGKDVATVAGTLIGAAVGHNSGHRTVNTGEYRTEHRERCTTHVEYRYEDRPDGYRVSYRYHGEIFHTRMNRHPGKRLRIKVQISLAD